MGDDGKSYVKGYRRKRPGGGFTYVKRHTRKKIGKAGVVGIALFAVAVVAFAAAMVTGDSSTTPLPEPSVSAPAVTEEPPLPTENPGEG